MVFFVPSGENNIYRQAKDKGEVNGRFQKLDEEFRQEIAGKRLPPPAGFTVEQVDYNRNMRNAYAESREAVNLEKKEFEIIDKIIGSEFRDRCMPEIDAYVDCIVGRYFSIWRCKEDSNVMRRCLRLYETPE